MRNKNQNFKRSTYKDILDYFDDHIEQYDSYAQNPFWSFSDDLLKYILIKFLRGNFKNRHKSIKIFDAGAGSGNWSKFLLDMSTGFSILLDINPKMLNTAVKKLNLLHRYRFKAIEGNLEILADYPKEKSDVVICLHGVIGMARNTSLILKNLYYYLEDNGIMFLMAPNKFHAYNFSKKRNNILEMERVLKDGSVKFKSDMPEMFCYYPDELEKELREAGFENITILGFPVTIYPVSSDTKPLMKDTTEIQLRDSKKRKELFEMEKILSLNPRFAYQGNNLIAIAKK